MNSCKKPSPSKLVLGADEAGYGPNLGPLVVAVSCWKVPKDLSESEFEDGIAQNFSTQAFSLGCTHVPLGDSKQLYSRSSGLLTLESGLLSLLGCCASVEKDFAALKGQLGCAIEDRLPWYQNLQSLKVPCRQLQSEIERLTGIARQAFERQSIELLRIRVRVITEPEFNRGVAQLGSKGALLSSATMQLVAETLGDDALPAEIYCDRQGGRKNYLPVLLDAFPEDWFHEVGMNKTRCSYENPLRERQFHFSTGGDRFPPTALASMAAKYVRERMMESFNGFWKSALPKLVPTAGYPVDARRFRQEVAAMAKKLKLSEEDWWRVK